MRNDLLPNVNALKLLRLKSIARCLQYLDRPATQPLVPVTCMSCTAS